MPLAKGLFGRTVQELDRTVRLIEGVPDGKRLLENLRNARRGDKDLSGCCFELPLAANRSALSGKRHQHERPGGSPPQLIRRWALRIHLDAPMA